LSAKPTLAWAAEVIPNEVAAADAGSSAEPALASLRAQFDQLFHEYAPYVLRVLPRMGVAERDLDDVVQEVFLAVFRALPGFEGRSSTRTWVYGICIRTCSNYRQRAHRRHERLPGALPDAAHQQTPERALQTSVALAQLDAALSKLSQPDREAFVLFEIEQLSAVEIAQALGCSKFTVYTRLYRARRAVSARMREPGEEATDA
jgi:RNA polymerase sigma-70 factor, ECF subfamily